MRAVKTVRRVRSGLEVYPNLLPLLREAWGILGMTKAADGTLFRSGFVEMNIRLQQVPDTASLALSVCGSRQVLNPKANLNELLAVAAWDWANDRQVLPS